MVAIESLIFRTRVSPETALYLNQLSTLKNNNKSDVNPLPFHLPLLSTKLLIRKSSHYYSRFATNDFFITGKCFYINKSWHLEYGVSKSCGLRPEMSLGQIGEQLRPLLSAFPDSKLHSIEIANHCNLRISESMANSLYNYSISQSIQSFQSEQVGSNTYRNSSGNYVSSKTVNLFSKKSSNKPIHFSFYNLDGRIKKHPESGKLFDQAVTNFEYVLKLSPFGIKTLDDLTDLKWVELWLVASRKVGFKPKSLRYRNQWKGIQDEIMNSIIQTLQEEK